MTAQRILSMIARRVLTKLIHRGLNKGTAGSPRTGTGKAMRRARHAVRSARRR